MAQRKRNKKLVVIDGNPVDRNVELGSETGDFSAWYCPFMGMEETLRFIRKKSPSVVLLGFRFPGALFNGVDLAEALRSHRYRGIIAGNSSGGRKVFENQGVELDFYVNRSKRAFRELLERIRQGTIQPRRRRGR